MQATLTDIDPFDLPEWLGTGDVVSRNIYRLKQDASGYFLVGNLANQSAAAGFNPAVFVDDRTDAQLTAGLSAARAAVATAVGGGNLSAGLYRYRVAFVDATGTESNPSDPISVQVAANGSVNLTLPTGPADTLTRKLYRTKAGGSVYFYLDTVDNTDANPDRYTDTWADNTLTRLARWNAGPSISQVTNAAMATSTTAGTK